MDSDSDLDSGLQIASHDEVRDDDTDSNSDTGSASGADQDLTTKSDGDAVLKLNQKAVIDSDGMFRVIIIPTAATGASGTREEPQRILFKWPAGKADDNLQGEVGRESDKKNETYLSVFETVFNQRLEPFKKKVIVYDDKVKTAQDSSPFKCTAKCSTGLMNFAGKNATKGEARPIPFPYYLGQFKLMADSRFTLLSPNRHLVAFQDDLLPPI